MARASISTKNAIAEIKRLVKELNDLREQVKRTGAASKASFDKLESSTANLKRKYAEANTTISKLNKTIRTQQGEMSKLSKNTDKAGRSIERTGKKSKKANAGMGSLTRGVKQLFAAFGLIMGVQLFATIIKDTFKLILAFDSLRFATEKITENTWEYSQSMEFLLLLNRRYGAELIVTTERWIKFLAAAKQSNVTLLDTEKIFESVTKAAASFGLSTEDLKSVYLAIEQMLSKGKITTEELRRQLGEKLPGAMGIMAASIGVTIPMLDKMLRKGEILSAEVLPDFADALEIAYGIQAVKKVDTLRAGIGRLAGGWQTFVANIGESEGPLIQVFSSVIGTIDKVLQRMILFNADDKQRERLLMPQFTEAVVKSIEDQAKRVVEALTGIKDADEKIEDEMIANRIAADNTADEKELQALNDHYDELMLELVNYGKAVVAEKRSIAADGFLELKKEKEDTEAAYKSIVDNLALYKKGRGGLDIAGITSNYQLEQEILLLEEKKILTSGILKSLTAEYDYKRKLLEISGVATVPEDEGAAKRKARNIEDIADLEKQVQIAILKQIIAGNEAALSAEETGWEKRIFLTKDQQKKKNRISELQLEIEIEDIKKAEAAKLKELNRPSTDKEKPIAKGVITDQTLVIEKEAMQNIEIAENKHYANLISNGNAAYNTLLGITKETNKDKIEVVEDTYNKEIIAAKNAYNASDKIASDKKRLENELKRIAIKSANEQIDLQIAILKVNLAKLQSVDADEEVIASTKRLINTLEASKQTMFNDDDSPEKFKKDLETMLGYASEYSQAIGGIVDGIYGQRIEAINAEIQAEKDKYDKLLLLAEGDEEQRDTLRRDRDIKIAKLEKKRLKEEQKQAKARKAFAIAEIVINTAVAISKVLSQSGLFGIPLVPVVAALGALQIAAVLAQPIPKYKDGGKVKKDETAMINDGMYKEYVERNGSILTNDRKNAIVNLEAGDVVHKDYKSLNKDSDVVSGMTGGSYISENEFNRLFLGVTSSIVDGFKKAKIINNIKASSNNNSYRDKMSRWNG